MRITFSKSELTTQTFVRRSFTYSYKSGNLFNLINSALITRTNQLSFQTQFNIFFFTIIIKVAGRTRISVYCISFHILETSHFGQRSPCDCEFWHSLSPRQISYRFDWFTLSSIGELYRTSGCLHKNILSPETAFDVQHPLLLARLLT